MKLYFDTAYVAKCYLNEPDGKAVRKLAMRASGLYSSLLCVAELACVFQRQIRERKISPHQAAEWRSRFLEDIVSGIWVLFPVSDRLLYRVETLLSGLPPDAYIRAGDAIHLVTATDNGFEEIWSNDRHLLAATDYFGLKTKTI